MKPCPFLRIQPECTSLSGPEAVSADVTYAGQGLYDARYATPRVGSYLVDVAATEQGGLVGQYFNNRWLYGDPA